MYKKLVIQVTVILLLSLPALQVFAGGVQNPNLVVETPSETSRLISLDWSSVTNADKYRWGLYRFDLEEKSFTLIDELEPFQGSYLDEDIEPPLSKYYYKIEHVSQRASLEKTRPERLNQDDVQEQLKSAYQAPPAILSPKTETDKTGSDPSVNDEISGNYWEAAEMGATYGVKSARNSSYFNEGIYIGAIGFSGKVNDITHNPDGSPALVLLDGDGRQALLENLARGYLASRSSGTALYYADHKALTNLSKMKDEGSLPGNIDSVTIITFTDGIDTSSTDISFPALEGRRFKSGNAYNAFISQQLNSSVIRSRLPGVKKFNAWSIGIPGKDVQNNAEFGRGLQAVGPDDFSEFTNVSQIEKILLGIADKLLLTYKPRINFTLSTPAYPVGTQLRITFDGFMADVSDRYIEGRVSLDENSKSYILNVTGQVGMKIIEEKPRLEGKRDETGIDYTMILADEFQESKVQQWYIQPGEEAFGWMRSSEFATSKTADFTYERKSEIISLVVDCSSSHNEKEIDSIRSAIGVFINRLYSALYDPSERNNIDANGKGAFKRNDAQTYTASEKSSKAVSELYIQTYKPEGSGQSSQPASEVVVQAYTPEQTRNQRAASSGYQTQTYTRPAVPGASVNPSSGYKTQTYTQPAVPGTPSSASRTQTSTGQAAAAPPVSEIIIQTYKQPDSAPKTPQLTVSPAQTNRPSDAASRVPQVTIPLNKSIPPVSEAAAQAWQRTNTEQTATVQVRPSNKPPSVSSVSVIETFSISNAPVNGLPRNGYWVQIGSYSDANRAQHSLRVFSNIGIGGAEIFSTNVNGATYYRVKAGPYPSKEDAERALARMKNHSSVYNDSFITYE
jgi:cell division protein FtsN